MADKITLSAIAKSLKVSAKVARRRVRTAQVRKPKDGWVFPAAKRAEISKIVRG